MTPKLRTGQNYGLRYRFLNVEKEKRGVKLVFGGEKFEYTNDSSFERAHRAESNDTKINAI